MNEPLPDRADTPERPPLFGSWRRWYLVVIGELAVIMAAAYLLTEVYR